MKVYWVFALFGIVSGCSQSSPDNDFDRVCLYFDRLGERVEEETIPSNEQAGFIMNLVENNVEASSPAREALELVLYAEPDVRYEMYSEAAFDSLNQDWSCEPMEELLPSLEK